MYRIPGEAVKSGEKRNVDMLNYIKHDSDSELSQMTVYFQKKAPYN